MRKFVFDLDGTLCDLSHRLHHISDKNNADWDAFYTDVANDAPIADNVGLCRALLSAGENVEFWTGRSEVSRTATLRWLEDNVDMMVDLCTLKMRQPNDRRPDYVVKREFLDETAPPTIIFEDRDRVVEMWRDVGITCHHVTKGSY